MLQLNLSFEVDILLRFTFSSSHSIQKSRGNNMFDLFSLNRNNYCFKKYNEINILWKYLDSNDENLSFFFCWESKLSNTKCCSKSGRKKLLRNIISIFIDAHLLCFFSIFLFFFYLSSVFNYILLYSLYEYSYSFFLIWKFDNFLEVHRFSTKRIANF